MDDPPEKLPDIIDHCPKGCRPVDNSEQSKPASSDEALGFEYEGKVKLKVSSLPKILGLGGLLGKKSKGIKP